MKELLLFARPPKPKRAPTDVVPLVALTADLLSQDPSLQRHRSGGRRIGPPLIRRTPRCSRSFFRISSSTAPTRCRDSGRIRVAVRTLDSTCQIAFTDAGPGIPADVREKIFTPFFTTKSRGSGLGLPTAKRLVEAHNGQIVIDCPPSGGTTVFVRLPMGF